MLLFLNVKNYCIIKVDSIISFNNIEKDDNSFSLKEPFKFENKEIPKEKTEEEEIIPKKKGKKSQFKGKKDLDNNNVLKKKDIEVKKVKIILKAIMNLNNRIIMMKKKKMLK